MGQPLSSAVQSITHPLVVAPAQTPPHPAIRKLPPRRNTTKVSVLRPHGLLTAPCDLEVRKIAVRPTRRLVGRPLIAQGGADVLPSGQQRCEITRHPRGPPCWRCPLAVPNRKCRLPATPNTRRLLAATSVDCLTRMEHRHHRRRVSIIERSPTLWGIDRFSRRGGSSSVALNVRRVG